MSWSTSLLRMKPPCVVKPLHLCSPKAPRSRKRRRDSCFHNLNGYQHQRGTWGTAACSANRCLPTPGCGALTPPSKPGKIRSTNTSDCWERRKRDKGSFSDMLVGYMRVSSDNDRQTPGLQRDALPNAGVDPRHLFEDKASGARDDRPGLQQTLAYVRPGDCLVVWKLDHSAARCRIACPLSLPYRHRAWRFAP